MKDIIKDQPKRHPDTGKVKNPTSGNFVTVEYADRQGFLEDAEYETQRHFADLAEENELEKASEEVSSDEIDQLLEETESANPGEAFAAPEVPESEFPEAEQFEDPPQLDDPTAKKSVGDGRVQHKGVYTGANANDRPKNEKEAAIEEDRKKRAQMKTLRNYKLGGMRIQRKERD